MRLIQPCTISNLFFLALLLLFGLIFLNQKAQAHTSDYHSVSEERLDTMDLYLDWIRSGEYGEFNKEPGIKVYSAFEAFLNTAIEYDKNCLITPQTSPTPIERIKSFFSRLIDSKNQNESEAEKLSKCKEKIKIDYKLAKKYNRLLKYLQIEAGKPNLCVKADLGIGKALKAKGFNPAKVPPSGGSDNPKETGVSEPLQVYLCTGNDGLKKVRVVDSSGTRLRLSEKEALKPEFQIQNLPTSKSYEGLLEKLSLK